MRLIKSTPKGKQRVYDIEVADVHNFYANGVNVHNCATDGGVSVIKDDGTVVDITGQTEAPYRITFNRSNPNEIITSGYWTRVMKVYDIPTSDINENAQKRYYVDSQAPKLPFGSGAMLFESTENQELIVKVSGGTPSNGFYRIAENLNTKTNGMNAYIRSDCNTGWMHGDIKGAFLSDTDATNVTGSELIVNGTFSSALGSEWQANNSSGSVHTFSIVSGELEVVRGNASVGYGEPYQAFSTVVGKTYTITLTTTSGDMAYLCGTTIAGTQYFNITTTNPGTTYSRTFTATSTTGYILIIPDGANTTARTDNISLRIAEEDRSVNNKGLQVFGTITKSAVATGAELVGYRPPSGTIGDNYLSRPLTSSDFDLTSDWSITFWAKRNEQDANNYSGFEIAEDDITGNVTYAKIPFSIFIDVSGNTGWRGAGVTGYQYNTLFDTQDVWKCVTTISKSGTLYIYVNGKYVTSTPATFTNPSNPYSLGIFRFTYSTSRHDGRRHIDYALFRMSNSAPSPEQIKKIYEDEKVLFQENAACTLYGSSDAVTALAYDDSTNLLYAGTSSGRSDFQGLRRINNTTTAVTTAISASNGLIAEQ